MSKGTAKMFHGLLGTTAGGQGKPQAIMDEGGEGGLRIQGFAILGDRVVQPAAAGENEAQGIMGRGEVGLQFQRLLILGDRLIDTATIIPDVADVVVGLGELRIDSQRFLAIGASPPQAGPASTGHCQGCCGPTRCPDRGQR